MKPIIAWKNYLLKSVRAFTPTHTMLGETRVKLILLVMAFNFVFSCLVTNCPRGGKRGDQATHFRQIPSNVIHSELRMGQLCNPAKEICLGVYSSSEVTCEVKGPCVKEICCSKRFCTLRKFCGSNFQLQRREELKRNSIILSKILNYIIMMKKV